MNNDPLGLGGNFIQGSLPTYRGNTTQSKKKKKGFWQDQISTGGSMGGAAGGAALGAAAGSVVPVVGTAIGGLLGAILGGAGGGALGQRVENSVAGDDLNQDVLKEGLLGGAFSAGPLRMLSVAKGATGAAFKGAGASGVRDAVEQGITATPIRDFIGRKAAGTSKLGDSLLGSQSLLTGSQARNLKVLPQQTIGSINSRTGLTGLDDMAEFGQRLTGGQDSLLDAMTRGAVSDAGRVNVGDLRGTARSLIDESGALIDVPQSKRVLEHITQAGVSMRGGAKGSLDPLAQPLPALDQANAFRGIARDLTNGFNVSPDQRRLGTIYNKLAGQIEDGIYNNPNMTGNFGNIVKSGADDLLFMADDLAKTGNKAQAAAARKIADEVRQVKTLKDLRTLKKDFVDVSKIDTATAQAQGVRTMSGEDMTKKAGNILRNPMNLLAAPLDASTPAIGGALKKLAARGPQGVGSNAGITPLGAAGRSALGGSLLNAMNTQPDEAQVDQFASQMMTDPGFDQGQQLPDEEASANPFGVSSDQVAQLMMVALQNGDTKGLSQLKSLHDMVSEYEASSGGGKLNAAATKQVTNSANGEVALDQLEGLLARAGGGSGAFGGRVKGALGAVDLDQNAKLYNDSLQGYVPAILLALGKTDAPSATELAGITKALPQITDTREQAASKLADLRARIRASQANAVMYGNGSDPVLAPQY